MGSKGRRSLQTKIITWSFAPTAIILLAVALVTFFAYQRVTATLALERERELTRLAAGQLSLGLAPFSQELDTLARTVSISQGSMEAQQVALRNASSRLVVFDGGVVVLDARGRVRAAQPERPEIVGQDWSGRDYFRNMTPMPAPAYSGILADGPNGSEVIAVAVPVFGGNGDFRGTLVGMFKLGETAVSALYGSIVKLRMAEDNRIYLVDDTGRVIYGQDMARVGDDLSAQPAVRSALQGDSGAIHTTDESGVDVVAGFAPVPGTPWSLVAQQSLDTLAGAFQNYGQFLILLLTLGVLVPAVVVTAGVRRITQPIDDLIVASQEVARGHFGQAIVANTGDEIEDLANQFNLMSAQLQQYVTQLQEQIADRSRALIALNSVAEVVNRSMDLDEILRSALDRILQVMEIDAGGVYVIDEGKQHLELVAYKGLTPRDATLIGRMAIGEGYAGRVVASGLPIVVDQIPAEYMAERFGNDPPDFHAAASIPLASSGKALGAMFVTHRSQRRFSPQDIELLTSIGLQIGVAMENTQLIGQLKKAAAVEERQRLARELHDAVTQTLFSASLIAEVLPRIMERNPEEGRRRLEELRQLSRGALAEMRTLLMELRPAALVEAPLADLLRQLTEAFSGRARLPIDLSITGDPSALEPDVKIAFYRVAQEALNNVAKHSGATRAGISLEVSPDQVELTIVDNGVGFDPDGVGGDHLGVPIMRERVEAIGATLEIVSQPGQGTSVTATWQAGRSTRPAAFPDATEVSRFI